MSFPPGLGETDAIVNLEENIGKVAGRIKPMPAQDRYAKLLRMGKSLTGGKTPYPKGVYFFKTHEEANQWEIHHILRKAVQKNAAAKVVNGVPVTVASLRTLWRMKQKPKEAPLGEGRILVLDGD